MRCKDARTNLEHCRRRRCRQCLLGVRSSVNVLLIWVISTTRGRHTDGLTYRLYYICSTYCGNTYRIDNARIDCWHFVYRQTHSWAFDSARAGGANSDERTQTVGWFVRWLRRCLRIAHWHYEWCFVCWTHIECVNEYSYSRANRMGV